MRLKNLKSLKIVTVNGVEVRLKDLVKTLSRYTTAVVVVNDDDIYRVSLRGSGTLLHRDGSFYLACCYHQVRDCDLRNVGIFHGDEAVVVTSNTVLYSEKSSDSDFHDLMLFDFTETVKRNPNLKHKFFNFKKIAPKGPLQYTAFLQVSGYVSQYQEYDLGERNHLGLARSNIICRLNRSSNDHSLLVISPAEKPLDYDPDGLSGGAAFTVQFVDGKANVFFAGIVTRAGKRDIHILKSGYILSMMKP
ncbi:MULTISPECIES: hypothetical protein [Agrobacterium]|uniref:hypothetical protein n=1 Tax=Agrobacterium TaxID=357 RepID=UPI000B22C901|nr:MULTISPECIES: hypothetical protein [Agrobacterium]